MTGTFPSYPYDRELEEAAERIGQLAARIADPPGYSLRVAAPGDGHSCDCNAGGMHEPTCEHVTGLRLVTEEGTA